MLALCEPGDEVVCFEPYYDSYAACIALARRDPAAGHPAPDQTAGTASTRTSCAPPSRRGRGWCCSTRRTTRPGRSSPATSSTLIAELCQEYDAIAVTDEVYEHLGLHGRVQCHTSTRDTPRDAGAHAAHLLGRQDLLLHGLEDRLGQRTPPARLRGAAGQAVPHLRQRRPRCSRRWPSRSACPTRTTTSSAAELQAKRDLLAAGLAEAGFEVLRPEGTYFITADISPLGGTDGVEFCRRPARAVRRGGRAHPGLLRPPGGRPAPDPVRLLQARPRSSPRPSPACRPWRLTIVTRPVAAASESVRPATCRAARDHRGQARARTTAATCRPPPGQLSGLGLHHHPDQRLGARRPQQHPAGLAQLGLGRGHRGHHRWAPRRPPACRPPGR